MKKKRRVREALRDFAARQAARAQSRQQKQRLYAKGVYVRKARQC